jgi:AmiR/NasT family two-component response regulator
VTGGGADEQLRIGVAADDAVHDDHVGGIDRCFLLGEVAVAPFDPRRGAGLCREGLRLLVVTIRQLDDHRSLRSAAEELEIEVADAPADLEHARTVNPSLGELVHKPLRGRVEPALPVALRIASCLSGSEEAVVGRAATGAHSAESTIRAMRILVAEDETIIRLDLRELLERAGFDVCAEAKDGVEAVELARSERPDLAVLDVKMPRLDGIEAARRILDERPIPIVMLTAYGQEELVSRAIEAGVFGYLVKPFREQDLLPAIRTARARHEELAALREQADSLAEALASRKSIERAKGLLMEREGLTEQEAFARLRKASQVSGRPMKVVAEAVVATFERTD